MSQQPCYLCREININGIPAEDDSVWLKVEKIRLIHAITGELPQQSTSFQMIRDDSQGQLFARFERVASQICSNFKLHDEPLWKQDVFELFICDEQRLDRYKEMQSSPWDVCFDGIISYDRQGKHHLNISWDAEGWKTFSVFNKTAGKLTSIWSIPYGLFSNKPESGVSWPLGIFTIFQQEQIEVLLSWQKIGIPNFHVPERFGLLIFE